MRNAPLLLHTEWSLGWGGQEIRILAEARTLRARGWSVAFSCRPQAQLARHASHDGFPIHVLPYRFPADPATVLPLAALLRRQRVSLVHTHSSVDAWCGGLAARLARVPVVRGRHLASPIRPGLNARLLYHTLADRVLCSGETIRQQVIDASGADPDSCLSIPAGADPALFHPGVDPSPVRAEFGLAPDDEVVGIVAVLRSWKGHRILLQAAASLLPRHPSLKILVVGDGPLRSKMEGWRRELSLGPRLLLTGHRDDVPALIKAMSVCVLPSLKNEATSQVLPQAMLTGTPVIASTAGGLTEVVGDGVTGRTVPPGDAPALARAIDAVLSDPAATARMADAARRRALERFTFHRQIDLTVSAYRQLLAGDIPAP